jgi:DNA-binding protein HU-beta
MIKAEIVQEIVNKTGLEKPTVSATVESLMEIMKQSMINGENIYLRGFGTFLLKKRAEKMGRNITKGTTVIIPAHFIPSFKPSKKFLNEVKSRIRIK